MAAVPLIAFTVPIAPWLVSVLAFIGNHLVYWIIPLALLYEGRYLASRKRLRHIAMFGWGEATRAGQPVFYGFLWLLHLTATAVLSLIFVGYVMERAGSG